MKTLLPALLLASGAAIASGIPKNENISSLIEDRKEISSLSEIQRLGLDSAESKLDLWSGSYWPHFQGLIASRYRDPSYQSSIKDEVQWEDIKKLWSSQQVEDENLSPAEKYDLLVGDPAKSLTNFAWEIGKKVKKGDKVATWRGLCDGWASASQMMPRPVKAVTLPSPSGKEITFFPEDIKALGSLLYAKAQGPTIFLGKRCFSSLLSFTPACNEANPGSFHKALANRVGAMGKSFIGDISPGGQVWNYPVKNYSFTYVNVFSKEESQDFREVMESYNKEDKKKKFIDHGDRHKNTRYIVGVKAVVNYQNMREKNLIEADGSAPDSLMEKVYEYDLELDGAFNVIGGENPAKNLPDFIWAPNDVTYPLSIAEKQGLGNSLVEQSQISAKEGQPLAQVVERLFELSK